MPYIGSCEKLVDYLHEIIDLNLPIRLYEDSARSNADYYGIFPGTKYCCFINQSHRFFGDGNITITFRPGSESEGAMEFYGEDFLRTFDDIMEGPEMNTLMPVELTVYDQSVRNSWDTRTFAIGVDTELKNMGDNYIALLPQLSFLESLDTHGAYIPGNF